MALAPKRQTAIQVQRPAPIGGINAKNTYADMPSTDAITLENWFPTTGGCKVRGGSKKYSSAANGQTINTLMVWNSPTDASVVSNNQKLLAAAGSVIYDVSVEGGVGTSLVTGLTSDKWQWTNFVNSAGTFLITVNGADQPVVYTTAGTVTRMTDAVGPTQVTGVGLSSTTKFINICSHKQRLWFVEKDSSRAWYGATNALYGTVTLFDFGYLFQKGGHLKALFTWTIDGGKGMDDHLVAISSKGEAVVYAGTDPSTANTWSLVGVFYIGSPVGYRCWEKIDGDVAVITQFGLVPLSQALQSTQVNANELAFTDKIQLLISKLISDNFYAFGWQCLVIPKFNMLLINVPQVDGTYAQYVMNTTLLSWAKFTNFNSSCLAQYYDDLFIAKGNIILKALYGNLDDVEPNGTGGAKITAVAQQAFDFFDAPGVLKTTKFIKPTLFAASTAFTYGAKVYEDYKFLNTTDFGTFSATGSVALWDTALWDVSTWAVTLFAQKSFLGSSSLSYGFSTALMVNSATDINWISTAIIYETGGLLG